MNNFDKSVLAFKFIEGMNILSSYAGSYFKILTDKYPNMVESNFILGERVSTSTNGKENTWRLGLQVHYRNKFIKLQIQKTWIDELGIPSRKYIQAIQYKYNSRNLRSAHSWISHLGASMYYGDYTDDTIVVDNKDVQLLSVAECNSLLQGSTEELEFQYSTLHPFNNMTMIQYGILSLLTSDCISDTVNVIAPDLSSWGDSLQGLDEVIELFRKGTLTI